MSPQVAALAVGLCHCGHPLRAHEEDEDGERGLCLAPDCPCSAFDADPPRLVDATKPADEPEPAPHVNGVQVEKPSPRCEPCGMDFGSPQALGAHRRYKHSGRPVNTRPDVRPNATATATQPPAPTIVPTEGARYSLQARFVLPSAGTVHFRLDDATEAELLAWLPLVANLPTKETA